MAILVIYLSILKARLKCFYCTNANREEPITETQFQVTRWGKQWNAR